ncbi:MAG: ammonia-forming cytochrome c nitrite reductase subunit c552 [Planctomycetota bacterium]|nr:ammonia-forming cytochrome c nitrite reductase subunit c552 [Planctomycetota bacterium]
MSFDDIRAETEHTIGCANCHDGSTLELRLTNVALIEALEKDGRRAEDLSRQEMRSMVCANCHVEYYFAKDAYLTLPWDNGRKPEQMLDYYDSIDFKDWTNATSGADMVKMQHPDYELFTTGVHYKRGLACADCHMPYSSQGGVKYTDHHVQSPLKNVGNVCLVCHRFSEQEAIDLVHERQNIVWDLQKRACDLLAIAHEEVGKAAEDFSDEQLASVRYNLRASQIRWTTWLPPTAWAFTRPRRQQEFFRRALTSPRKHVLNFQD